MSKIQVTEALLARARKIFDRRADRDKVYITADGQIFTKESDATGQAANLKRAGSSNEVYVLSRDVAMVNSAMSAIRNTPPAQATQADTNVIALTPLQVALGIRDEAIADASTTEKEQEVQRTKLASLKDELARLPITAHANKKSSLTNKIAATERRITELGTALAAATAKAQEAAAKVVALQTDEELDAE